MAGFGDFLSDQRNERSAIMVDAVFGAGFRGEASGIYGDILKKMNLCGSDVFSVDIPSGLDATTGRACCGAIKARTTVTFGLAKEGFFINDGPSVCGHVVVKNIGFPEELLDEYRRR